MSELAIGELVAEAVWVVWGGQYLRGDEKVGGGHMRLAQDSLQQIIDAIIEYLEAKPAS